ncbi:MAG TPA: hypothetical protein VHO94_01425 [Oscillospiraceae bacterium]|nr:hypothetical protein [Oscillospiraceae bacterium]
MKKILAIVCVIVCAIASLTTGCSSQNTSSQSSNINAGHYGKVTSINGKELTLELGTLNMGAYGNRTKNGNSSGSSNYGGGQFNKSHSGAPSGSAPARPKGNTVSGAPQQGSGTHELLKLTGEKKVITVTDQSTISMQARGDTSPAAFSDIKVGSILKITMNGSTLSTIEIMQFGRGNFASTSSK